MDLNKAIVCGRLGADPECSALPSGVSVASFTVVSNRKWNQDGETKEQAEFHRIVVFGKQGDACATFLRKGATALVEGRIQTRSWETEGIRHYRTEIVAEHVTFGPRSSGAGKAESSEEKPAPREEPKTAYTYPEEELDPESIPF